MPNERLFGAATSGAEYVYSAKVKGWRTTASTTVIELWSNAFSGVRANSGVYHAELNADQASTLYQVWRCSAVELIASVDIASAAALLCSVVNGAACRAWHAAGAHACSRARCISALLAGHRHHPRDAAVLVRIKLPRIAVRAAAAGAKRARSGLLVASVIGMLLLALNAAPSRAGRSRTAAGRVWMSWSSASARRARPSCSGKCRMATARGDATMAPTACQPARPCRGLSLPL